MLEKQKKVSIVIPCYNEEKNIDRTFDGLLNLAENSKYLFEIIAVDDGSRDNTWSVIESYSSKHNNIIGVNQMANFGQSAAYQAGFDVSTGDFVITVSADLEIPLEHIIKVIEHLESGFDFVNTNRVGRWGGNGLGRAGKSGMANKVIKMISGATIKDTGSGMKGFTRAMADSFKFYGEMHRYIPAYLTVYGAKMFEFDVEFKDRDYGKSAYMSAGDWKRTLNVLLDLLTMIFMLKFAKKPFSFMPGRLFGFTGALISGVGSIGLLYLLILKLLGYSIGDRPLFMLSALMVVVGIQSIMMGMLGELMMRIYFESAGRKTYTIRKITN